MSENGATRAVLRQAIAERDAIIIALRRERDDARESLARMLASYSALRAGGNPEYVRAAVMNLEEAFLFATAPRLPDPKRDP